MALTCVMQQGYSKWICVLQIGKWYFFKKISLQLWYKLQFHQIIRKISLFRKLLVKDTAFGRADKKSETIIFYQLIKRSLCSKGDFSRLTFRKFERRIVLDSFCCHSGHFWCLHIKPFAILTYGQKGNHISPRHDCSRWIFLDVSGRDPNHRPLHHTKIQS